MSKQRASTGSSPRPRAWLGWACALVLTAAGAPALAQQASAAPPTPSACTSAQAFVLSDCSLTWRGITLYGAYDIGAGWVSHGLPENGYNYEGESLVNKNGDRSRFLLAPNNLSQTGLGLKAKEEFLQGWSVVFNALTGINPQSGDLANEAAPPPRTPACPEADIPTSATARAPARCSTTNSTAGCPPPSSAR